MNITYPATELTPLLATVIDAKDMGGADRSVKNELVAFKRSNMEKMEFRLDLPRKYHLEGRKVPSVFDCLLCC